MNHPKGWRTAPPDDACDKAWAQIMSIARHHCLVVNGYGGAVTLATPEEQRRHEGLRQLVLEAHTAVEP